MCPEVRKYRTDRALDGQSNSQLVLSVKCKNKNVIKKTYASAVCELARIAVEAVSPLGIVPADLSLQSRVIQSLVKNGNK